MSPTNPVSAANAANTIKRFLSPLPRGWSLCPVALLVFASACSHGPSSGTDADPRALLGQACNPGAEVKSAKGAVWLKAKSKEASGQFPAVVDAPSIDSMKMEVTNLVGGTEAVLSIDGHHYKIDVPRHRERNEQGDSSWGGIPLEWANSLFLGRIPCPVPRPTQDAAFSKDALGQLVVETPESLGHLSEKFVYHLRPLNGGLWPDTLHWERRGIGGSAPVTVDFKFEDPEDKTLSPRKWEAKSSQGEVKVRWKDRQIEVTR